GYSAFNAGDWATLEKLLFGTVKWHPMDGKKAIVGRKKVIDHLKGLHNDGIRAEFRGVANHGTDSIAVDLTSDPNNAVGGDHACADKIVFDDNGCILEVWHCSSGTHAQGGHAGHAPGHDHP
ncbi:MAG: hypothetical protein ACRD0O_19405, partial [Acidimicrobiia bacterium]